MVIHFVMNVHPNNRANDGIAFVDVVLYILLKRRNCWKQFVKRGNSHILFTKYRIKI